MIAALLGWTKLPQWAIELIALALVGGAILLWHHETFEAGVKQEVARVELQNAKTTATLTAKANTAETLHADENKDLDAFRSAHPIEPVRLCVPTPSLQTPAIIKVSSSAVATGADVQPVPAGDSGVRQEPGRDISELLDLLAGRADKVTAQARELQGRDQ